MKRVDLRLLVATGVGLVSALAATLPATMSVGAVSGVGTGQCPLTASWNFSAGLPPLTTATGTLTTTNTGGVCAGASGSVNPASPPFVNESAGVGLPSSGVGVDLYSGNCLIATRTFGGAGTGVVVGSSVMVSASVSNGIEVDVMEAQTGTCASTATSYSGVRYYGAVTTF